MQVMHFYGICIFQTSHIILQCITVWSFQKNDCRSIIYSFFISRVQLMFGTYTESYHNMVLTQFMTVLLRVYMCLILSPLQVKKWFRFSFMGLGLGLWCLTPLSTIFQLYRGRQFYWWTRFSFIIDQLKLKCGLNWIMFSIFTQTCSNRSRFDIIIHSNLVFAGLLQVNICSVCGIYQLNLIFTRRWTWRFFLNFN
jgi:hypothetical protein